MDFLAFPCGSAGKESTSNEGDLGSIPGLARSSGDVKGYPLQYSGLKNSVDCIVHGVAESQTSWAFKENEHSPPLVLSISNISYGNQLSQRESSI